MLVADHALRADDLVERRRRSLQIGPGDVVAGLALVQAVQLPAAELDAHPGEHEDHQRGGDPADIHQATRHISNLSHRLKQFAPGT